MYISFFLSKSEIRKENKKKSYPIGKNIFIEKKQKKLESIELKYFICCCKKKQNLPTCVVFFTLI